MRFLSSESESTCQEDFSGFTGTTQPRTDPWQPVMWLVALNIALIPITAAVIPVCLVAYIAAVVFV